PEDVLDLLASLVEKSLVILDESEDVPRYKMLETIREYAAGKLGETGEEKDATGRAHCDYFFSLSKQARDGLMGEAQGEWIRRLETDLDNVRSALALSLACGADPFIAVKICVALHSFWILRGYATEIRGIVRKLLDSPSVRDSDLAHAWALYIGAGLAESQSDHAEARTMLEQCLALRRASGRPIDIAATLSTLSLARLQSGDTEAAERGEQEALKIFRELGDKQGEAVGLCHLGQICHRAGKREQARAYLKQCLSLAQQIKHKEIEGACQLAIGELAFEDGNLDDAENWFKRSFSVCREAADKRGEANATRWLGKCDLQRGSNQAASVRLNDALRAFAAFEMWEELLGCLEDLSELLSASDKAKATRLLSSVAQARERLQLRRTEKEGRELQERLATLKQALGDDCFATEWEGGKSLDIREAIAQAQAPAEEPALFA
ncbi:MAG: tetratricopeptide repeat protein, partial [Burkholderiaceae bacterium]